MNDTTRTTTPQAGIAADAELRDEIRALHAELSAQRQHVEILTDGLRAAFRAAGVDDPMPALSVLDGEGRGRRMRRGAGPVLTLVTSSQLGA